MTRHNGKWPSDPNRKCHRCGLMPLVGKPYCFMHAPEHRCFGVVWKPMHDADGFVMRDADGGTTLTEPRPCRGAALDGSGFCRAHRAIAERQWSRNAGAMVFVCTDFARSGDPQLDDAVEQLTQKVTRASWQRFLAAIELIDKALP
jgi:hypothetical protein